MRRRRVYDSVGEDTVEKAGWMYADLFLGLMVIFLATISFVPQTKDISVANSGNRIISTRIKQSTNFNFDKGLTIIAKSSDTAMIETKVKVFLGSERLPLDSIIIFAKFIGGYDPATEDKSVGATHALEFGLKLRAENPQLFAHATYSADISTDIPSGQVAVVLTFSAPLKP